MNPLPPGTILGRYEIKRELGRGGMGAVYEATHLELKRRVAIKTLLAGGHATEEMRARFVREGQVSARVEHSHVVQVLDVGAERELLYLVMEFLEGEDLKTLLVREGVLDLERAVEILLPVIAGVAAAHREGVVHRDLKPANIFVHRSRDGLVTPKVLDFGIARLFEAQDREITKTQCAMGTIGYISPEQLQSARRVDAAADQYALGALFYHCLTGRKPFSGELTYELMHAVIHGQFAPPRQVVPSIPEAVEHVILRAMQSAPADRFVSVIEFGRALLAFASPPVRARWTSVFGEPSPDPGGQFAAPPGSSLPSQEPSPKPSISPGLAQEIQVGGTLTDSATALHAPHVAATPKRPHVQVLAVLVVLGVGALALVGTLTKTSRAPFDSIATIATPRRAPSPAPVATPPAPSTAVASASASSAPAAPPPSVGVAAAASSTATEAAQETTNAAEQASAHRRSRSQRSPGIRSTRHTTHETTAQPSAPATGTNAMPILQ